MTYLEYAQHALTGARLSLEKQQAMLATVPPKFLEQQQKRVEKAERDVQQCVEAVKAQYNRAVATNDKKVLG